MPKITVSCLQIIGAICIVQSIQLFCTLDMHRNVWIEERGEWKLRDTSSATQLNGFAYMFTLIALFYLIINIEPCTFFVRSMISRFKLNSWVWLTIGVGWTCAPVWFFFWLPLKLAFLDSVFVLSTAVSAFLVLYKLWRQKEEFEDFVERAIELNSTNGREMSVDQAHTLYRLHNYRKLTEQLRKRREASKSNSRNGPSRSYQQFRAINFEDYFFLSRWVYQLNQSEKPNNVQQQTVGEMRTHLYNYDLTDNEKEHLTLLANWEGLKMPEEDRHCGVVLEGLREEKK